MTGMPKARRVAVALTVLALTAAAVIAALILADRLRSHAQQAARLAALEAQSRELHTRSGELARENEALRLRLAELGEPQPHIVAAQPRAAAGASNLDQARILVKLQADLAAAANTIADLQARVQELDTALARALDETKRLAASELELREKLAGNTRLLDALQAELKTKSDRLTQTEATNLLLHKENREAAQRASQTRQLLAELEDINRRRENYLGNILRRYRELTDQLRTLAVRPEGAAESRPVDAAELSRIQSAVAMTEEDLRQLGSLNTQAARLQRKLAGQ